MVAYDPYEHADELGLTVLHRPIRTANELWLPDHNTIVIKSGMRAVHDKCALAHGIGHAIYGHIDSRPKHEIQADKYAAHNLIERGALLELAGWIREPNKLAQELGVTHRLLRTYLNTSGLLRAS